MEHLLIRSFAAATVSAVAAAAVLAGAFVAFAVGSAEAAGLTAGRTVIDVVDLPFGATKAEHVSMLRNAAETTEVDLALIVPDREGDASSFTAFVFAGRPAPPVFWARSDQRAASSISDEVITWTYGIDGSDNAVRAFLSDLKTRGFAYSVLPVSPSTVLLAGLAAPGVVAVATTVAAGLLVALLAESRRRAPRTRLRLLSGWSRCRIVCRDASEAGVLLAVCSSPVVAGLVVAVSARGGSSVTRELVLAVALVVVAVLTVFVLLAHVGVGLLPQPVGVSPGPSRVRTLLVGIVGATLVVLLTGSVHAFVDRGALHENLEQALTDEAAHGDDVTLGIGFADDDTDLALGMIGADAIGRGTARMAMTNFLPDTLLVAGGARTRSGPDAVTGTPPRDGVTVLVPQLLAPESQRIEAAVRNAFVESWEVDERRPPRELPIQVEIVDATSAEVQSAERWVSWAAPRSTTSNDLPVVLLHSLADLAPHRFGTAVHNGEVRFSDRAELDARLRDSGTIDVVTQINRVGASIERELAAVRAERLVSAGAVAAGAIALVLAALQLVGDHQVRSRRERRVRFLVGRSAAPAHLRLVCVVAATTFIVVVVSEGFHAAAMLVAGMAAIAATMLFAAVLLTVPDRKPSR